VLNEASGKKHWIARPVELPENTPLVFEAGRDPGMILREWPVDHVAKCLVYWHPDDPASLAEAQDRQIAMLGEACRQTEHELLLEVIADRSNPGDARLTSAIMRRIYGLGVRPDWWKLAAPADDAGWALIDQTIRQADPYCRGVLLLGLDAPEADLARSLAAAAGQQICKGFAIGRSIFGAAAEAWFAGKMDDEAAVAQIAAYYGRLTRVWQAARREHAGPTLRAGTRRNVG
jgi:5-dehydro-2-deoxygluconokinase